LGKANLPKLGAATLLEPVELLLLDPALASSLIPARVLFLGLTGDAAFFEPPAAFEDSGASSEALPRTDLREAGAVEDAGFDLVDAGLARFAGAAGSGEGADLFLPFTCESGLRDAGE